MLAPADADQPVAVHLRFGSPGRRILAPLGPGQLVPMCVRECRVLGHGETMTMRGPGTLAFDGEREIVLRPTRRPARIRVAAGSARVLDVAGAPPRPCRSGGARGRQNSSNDHEEVRDARRRRRLREMHRQMVRSRIFEETLGQVYMEGKTPAFDIAAGPVPGEMHLSAGQEPVAAGVCAHLRPTDAITATHRPHHQALAHGVDMKMMAAEIFGKETGLGHGKGGHMHLFSKEPAFGCSGIVAEGIPTAVGHALAFKKLGRDDIAVVVLRRGRRQRRGRSTSR